MDQKGRDYLTLSAHRKQGQFHPRVVKEEHVGGMALFFLGGTREQVFLLF
jgi:hypothetical protein